MSETVIYRRIPRPDKALIECLHGIPVADLYDVMDDVDQKLRLMNSAMRPIVPETSFVGPAVTAYNAPGDNLMMHTALYFAERGDVVVLASGGVPRAALWGTVGTITSQRNGIAAAVVDGPVRDTAQVRELRFPLFATSVSAVRPSQAMPGMVNVPIMCAGVLVRPGDIIVGDSDGVIVIAPADVERLAAAARARIEREVAMHAAITSGASTSFQHISGDAKLKNLGAVIKDGPWSDN